MWRIKVCKQCEKNPVYEFTNKRKLCKNCFIRYFQKKVLYIIRKFKMIKNGDVIGYWKLNSFRDVVLEDALKIIGEKGFVEIKKIPRIKDTLSQIVRKLKLDKITFGTTIDLASYWIINEIINGNIKDLEKVAPVDGKMIKPLYLFLDKEVLLYAKLRGLKFKKVQESKNKIEKFIDGLEKKHPEVKRAVVNSYLGLRD